MGQSTLRAAQMGGSLLLLLAALMVEAALLLPAMPRPAERGVGISKGLVEDALMIIYAAVKLDMMFLSRVVGWFVG